MPNRLTEIAERLEAFDALAPADFDGGGALGEQTSNAFWNNIEDDARWLLDEVKRLRAGVLGEIRREREHQNEKWGGFEHDRHHTDAEWHYFTQVRLAKLHPSRRDLVQAASLLVAQIETLDAAASLEGETE